MKTRRRIPLLKIDTTCKMTRINSLGPPQIRYVVGRPRLLLEQDGGTAATSCWPGHSTTSTAPSQKTARTSEGANVSCRDRHTASAIQSSVHFTINPSLRLDGPSAGFSAPGTHCTDNCLFLAVYQIACASTDAFILGCRTCETIN